MESFGQIKPPHPWKFHAILLHGIRNKWFKLKCIFFYICNQQRNQAGMEFIGFKSCMEFLIGYGLLVTAFVSDRHVSIAAYMKKTLTKITLYFDIWHLKKSKRNYYV